MWRLRGKVKSAAYSPPTFRVVALGPSGSGKTVYLASMFHQLSATAPGRSYRLETDAEHLIELNSIYSQVRDTDRPWPAGTRTALKEFVFDCVAHDRRQFGEPLLRLSYLDYRGGLLTGEAEAGSPALRELEGRINSAHALLGVIDGRRVRQLLLGEADGMRYFEHEIWPMFRLIEHASCPIHLVVSKWDLVRDVGEEARRSDGVSDEQARLELVREALLSFDHIRAIVIKNEDQIVRLIPVSAVGSRFGELDASGRFVKRHGAEIHPTNIEVPLCALLPDLFAQVERSLDQSVKDALRDQRRARKRKRALRVLAATLSAVLANGVAVAAAVPAVAVGDSAVGLLLSATDDTDDPAGLSGGAVAPGLAAAQSVGAAIMRDFRTSVSRLEMVLPGSVLSA